MTSPLSLSLYAVCMKAIYIYIYIYIYYTTKRDLLLPYNHLRSLSLWQMSSAKKRLVVVVKETLHGEARVSVVPDDVATLISSGKWRVRVEGGAGKDSGFTAADYEKAGAEVHVGAEESGASYFDALFDGAAVVCRCKRASRDREILESSSYPKGVFLLGFLYLLNDSTPHVSEWLQRTTIDRMIDLTQTDLPSGSVAHTLMIIATKQQKQLACSRVGCCCCYSSVVVTVSRTVRAGTRGTRCPPCPSSRARSRCACSAGRMHMYAPGMLY